MVDFVIVVLTIVEVILALMLIGLILIQPSKAGGGLGAIGGDMTQSVFGAGAATVLSKATTYIAAGFLGVTLLLAIITGHRQVGGSVAEQIVPEISVETPEKAPEASSVAADETSLKAESDTTDSAEME